MGNNAKLLLATLFGTLVMIIGVSVFFSNSSQPQIAEPVDEARLMAEATHMRGPANSPVTIVEFADYQCPFCAQINPQLKALLARYPEAKFVFRHFPLISIHANAVPAAMAAEAAHAQGKFWEMSDLLYDRQGEWDTLRNADEFFLGLARELQLDEAQFTAAYNDVAIRDRVYADLRLGEEMNVNSTPTFFYNGEPLSGISELEDRLIAEDFSQPSSESEASDASAESAESATNSSQEAEMSVQSDMR